jgi:hypothetical protein
MANYSVSIIGSQAGQAVVNVHGMEWDNLAGPETTEEANAVAEHAFATWKGAFLVRLSSGYTVTQAVARGMINPQVSGVSTGPPQSGARAEAALPTFAVGKIKIATTEPGRGGRGRTGLSGLIESYTDVATPNTLNGAAIIDLGPQVQQWFTQLGVGTPARNLSVISRFKGVDGSGKPVPRPFPVSSRAVSVSLDSSLGSRVSRLR